MLHPIMNKNKLRRMKPPS